MRNYANNGVTTLGSGCGTGDTSLTVVSAAVLPTIVSGSGDTFYLTLDDQAGSVEIVEVTAISGNVLTVVRARQSTTAHAFSSGALAHHRWTAQDARDAIIPAPPRLRSLGHGVCWQGLTGAPRTTASPTAGIVYWSLHYEELGDTYDSMNWTATAGAVGATATGYLRLPDPTTGLPGALLWTSVDTSHAASGEKAVLFASGTWEAAGAPFKDGSSKLWLPRRGRAVWVGYQRGATSVAISAYTPSESRPLSFPGLSTPAGPCIGFEEAVAYRSLPATPGGGTLTARTAGNVVAQVLIPVP